MAEEGVVKLKIKIKKIDISLYKSLSNFSIEIESDLTILTGLNGSGKTIILDAINTFPYNDLCLTLDEYHFSIMKSNNLKCEPSGIHMGVQFYTDNNKIYNIEYIELSRDGVVSKIEISGFDNKESINVEKFPDISRYTEETKGDIICGIFRKNVLDEYINNIEPFIPEFIYIRDPSSVNEDYIISQINKYIKELIRENYVYKLSESDNLDTGKTQKIINNLAKEIYPSLNIIFDIDVNEITKEVSIEVSIRNNYGAFRILSSGEKWIIYSCVSIAYLIYKKNKRNRILLMDEPCKGMHISVIQEFRKYIINLSNHHQIIYSTHESFLIQQSLDRNIRIINKEDGKITCEKISNSKKYKQLADLVPIFYARRDDYLSSIYEDKSYLILEGNSDYSYIQHMQKYMSEEDRLKTEMIKMINAGSITKIYDFLMFIPEDRKIIVMTDLDKSKESQDQILKIKNMMSLRNQTDNLIHPIQDKISSIEDVFDRNEFTTIIKSILKNIKIYDTDSIARKIDKYLSDNNTLNHKNHGSFADEIIKLISLENSTKSIKNFSELFRRINSMID